MKSGNRFAIVRKSGVLLLAAAAVVGGMVFGIAGSASAATAPASAAAHHTGGQLLIAPPAPANASSLSMGVAAVAPGISPAAASVRHGSPGDPINCGSGDLCPFVWDPVSNDWLVFYLYQCHTYALSNWHGVGGYVDSQTGDVTSTFYGQSHNVLASFKPSPGEHSYDWDPVWYIQNC